MSRSFHRRRFLQGTTTAAALSGWTLEAGAARPALHRGLFAAPFAFDVTPPRGHSCCGGWITPVQVIDDPLEAVGVVLLGAGDPIVLCAVDWTGLLNEAHLEWRTALAEAAGTDPDRVAVQCVHQHNAPMACLEAERIVAAHEELPHILDVEFFRDCLRRGREAVEGACQQPRRVTHVAQGQAAVQQVASNRRVARDDQRRIVRMRGSSCRDEDLRALPEGLIDPDLRTVSLYEGPRKIASLHYYATHPMSYYGDGRVSSDFAGLARKRRQRDEPDCRHVYFTGCAGNIAAGKYNDGSHEARELLTDRLYDGIVRSEATLRPQPVETIRWNTRRMLPPPRSSLSADTIEQQVRDTERTVVQRNRPSYMLSWLRRLQREMPIVLSSLAINDVRLLHLPAECFVQYQLRAQQLAGDAFVATAAYGDGGPWYIPVREEYACGGYEVSVAFCDPEVDDLLTDAIRSLLQE